MPRPKNGYVNAAGLPVPGTHDPLKRFKEHEGLIRWAYKRGCDGLPLYDRSAIDIGSTVHGLAELDLKGRPDREIEAYAHERLTAPDHLRKAFAAFGEFRAWRQQCQVRAIAQEVPMVSEAFQFGGTPDTIAMIGNRLGLLDFKTSPKPYPENLTAMAAHGKLWEETHPQHRLDGGYHLIILPKDGSAFQHHAYDDLSGHWKLFTLLLEAYRLEKIADEPRAPITVTAPPKMEAPAGAGFSEKIPSPSVTGPKPRRPRAPRVKTIVPAPKIVLDMPHLAASAPHLTMAEILRSYGHLKEECVAC